MSHLSRRSHLIHLPYLPHLSHAARCHPSWSVASAARDTRPSAAEKFCAQLRRSGHQLRLLLYHRRERPGGKTRGGLASLSRALREVHRDEKFFLVQSSVSVRVGERPDVLQQFLRRVQRQQQGCNLTTREFTVAVLVVLLKHLLVSRHVLGSCRRPRVVVRERALWRGGGLGRDSTLPGDAHPRLLIGRCGCQR